MAAAEENDKKIKGNIGDILIEYGHGITAEDKLLASKDKNAVDFVQNYSKLWCKCLKETIRSLEKRALIENACMRATAKLFQALITSVSATPEAPLSNEIIEFSRLIVKNAKEVEWHSSKRYRELIQVLKRQRTEFAKTREVLKAKWKADVKRMVDAESTLFKMKSAYFKCCQVGVKMREDLTTAQAILDESQAALTSAPPSSPVSPLSANSTASGSFTIASVTPATPSATADSSLDDPTSTAFAPPSSVDPVLANLVTKHKAKVERLEKQLGDNDKKEMELMYFYREAVDAANARLVELEKSRVEIICDTRLTVTKCDEVVSDSMAELISHLYVTRTKMLSDYEEIAIKFQNYIPGQPYHNLRQEHTQNGADFIQEKYLFEGYHDNPLANVKDRGDAGFVKFVSRFSQLYSKDTPEANDGRHSESELESEGEGLAQSNTTVLSSLVQLGSTLFRPDIKKTSVRGVRGARSGTAAAAVAEIDPEHLAAMEATAATEYDSACFVLIQCINGIETQSGGMETQGIYRVPASKIKVASVVETIRVAQESGYSSMDLSEEYAITLASTLKTRLIQLPEPLLSYSLYDQFVDVGKALEVRDDRTVDEQVEKLHNLIAQLSGANHGMAGLLFHHLKRVSTYESANHMGAANLAAIFGPTVLRRKPRFNVANMMEFVDNNWLMKAVELCIDRVADVFGPPSEFTAAKLLQAIRDRAAESPRAELLSTGTLERDSSVVSRTPYSIAFNTSTTDPSTALLDTQVSEDFTEKALKIALSESEQISTCSYDQKCTALENGEDMGEAISQNCSLTAPFLQEDLLPEPSRAGITGSGSVRSGLKRLMSVKAQNLNQRLQNITASCAENSARISRVFSPRKLLHSASMRISSKESARKPTRSIWHTSKERDSNEALTSQIKHESLRQFSTNTSSTRAFTHQGKKSA